MLSNQVRNLKSNGGWVEFERFFDDQINEALNELRRKAPEISQYDLAEGNAKIELFKRLKGLEKWSTNTEREGSKNG